MARKRPFTHKKADREALAQHLAEADAEAAQLRWNAFVDTMVQIAATLPERPVGPPEDLGSVEDSVKP